MQRILLITAQASALHRTLTFTSHCDEPVWMGFAGGSTQNASNSGVLCDSDADCKSGSSCIQTGVINQCFFHNPAPQDGDFKLVKG